MSHQNQIKDINKDVNDINMNLKLNIRNIIENKDEVEELKIRSEKINNDGKKMFLLSKQVKENSKCITFRMKTMLICFLILCLFIGVYFCISFLRCNSINVFC